MKIKRIIVLILVLAMSLSMLTVAYASDAEVADENYSETETASSNDGSFALQALESVEIELFEPTEAIDIQARTSAREGMTLEELDYDAALEASHARPRSGDFYYSIQAFIYQAGGFRYYVTEVFANEILNVQLDTPNSAAIDYDLAVYLILGNSLIPIGSSTLSTFINGSHGTLSESVGWANRTGATQNVVVFVDSYRGASNTLPFTLHFGFNTGFGNYEADSLSIPFIFDMPPVGYIGHISSRALNTRADNDWFRFNVPANRNFDSVILGLDDLSRSLGHVVELYTVQNNQARKVNINAEGVAYVTTGTHFIRVHTNQQPLSGQNYTLFVAARQTEEPPPPPMPGRITELTITPSDRITYSGRNRVRINGNTYVTFSGRAVTATGEPMAETHITFTLINEHWSLASGHRYRPVRVFTDENGRFTSIPVRTMHSTARRSARIPGAIVFIHWYDDIELRVEETYGGELALPGFPAHQNQLHLFAFSVIE